MKKNWLKCKQCGDEWASEADEGMLFDTQEEYLKRTAESISQCGLCLECDTF